MMKLKFVLAKDRRIQFSLLLLLIASIFVVSSLYILPIGDSPHGGSIPIYYSLVPGENINQTYTTIIPKGSIVNLSYHVPADTHCSYTLQEVPFGFLVSGHVEPINSAQITGNGSFTFQNTHSSETIILTLKLANGNVSSSPSFVLSPNPYYISDFNPYIFMLGILTIIAFCVSMAASLMKMAKNLPKYYTALGWYDQRNEEAPGSNKSINELVKEEYGQISKMKFHPLLFMVPGLLLYAFAVLIGETANPGLLVLGLIFYGIASVTLFMAILSFFLRRLLS